MKESALTGDPQAKKAMSHPYSLIPNFDDKAALSQLPDKGGSSWPAYSQAAQAWGAPFVMAACNERIVRMSNALTGWKLGALALRASSSMGCFLAHKASDGVFNGINNVIHSLLPQIK